jgi:S1/P1 Nuclease
VDTTNPAFKGNPRMSNCVPIMVYSMTRRFMRLWFFTLFVLPLLVLPARAWNGVGHQTIAELTWRQMSKGERRAASELLKQHPHYKEMLTADVPAGVDTNEWAFLNAATWPDRVRPAKHGHPSKPNSITKYDLYPHAIGFPFLRSGDTNRMLLENFFIARPDAEMVLSNCIATLRNTHASAEDRAVSLCWVMHLCGDLHQPLHAANLVTLEHPGGHSLGGSLAAMDPRTKKVIDLHSFWDQLPGLDFSYKAVAALAGELSADPELKPAKLKHYQENKTIDSWVQESFQVAVNLAYNEKHVEFVSLEAVKAGKIPTSAIPTLKADYIEDAQKIARLRLVLAARRLANELKQVW